ncbi:sugar nucleotide-binding protein [Candidatus Parcubacteria bacterium]|nr:sugar nucleotide-binding protein [Candidatus Parcubacteria bacterium]
MKYLITGGPRGWIAQKFAAFLSSPGGEAELSAVNIADATAIEAELDRAKPEVLINTAGKTGGPTVSPSGQPGRNIDWCEDHKVETLTSNVVGPVELVKACKARNIKLVHLSSGCIFQGRGHLASGFREDDAVAPPSFYSWTKYWADQYLMQAWPEGTLILRLRMPTDAEPGPRNLITKLAGYPKIIDVENSLTVIPDLLAATKQLIAQGAVGIYHVTNPGSVTHREIMGLYQKLVDPGHTFEFISEAELYSLGLASTGRSNCILNVDKLLRAGVQMPPIKERIREVMAEYAANLKRSQSVPAQA